MKGKNEMIFLTITEADVLRIITQPHAKVSIGTNFKFTPKQFYAEIDSLYLDELIEQLSMHKVWMNKHGIKSVLRSLEKELRELDINKEYIVKDNEIMEVQNATDE